MDWADLHIHSVHSDSSLTVREIFQRAKEKDLRCIALTDHDTTAGLGEANQISREYGIELVNGIEFSAKEEDMEVHILGYFINYKDNEFAQRLKSIKKSRKRRLQAMAKKLNSLGLVIDENEFFGQFVKDSMPSRLHLALYLKDKKYLSTIYDAFSRYLSPGKAAYVLNIGFSVKEAVAIIHKAGGLAFLAHPYTLGRDDLIPSFVKYGLDGIEVIYPRLNKKVIMHYAAVADRFGILKSGGSDAHGVYKKYTDVGGTKIPYEWVEEIKRRR